MTVDVVEVAPGVLRLHCRSWRGRTAGYDVSAYVMRGVLVDTGFPRIERELLSALTRLSVRGALVTHQHEDHAGNAAALAARGFPLAMHPACETVLRAAPPIGLYRSMIWGAPPPLTATLVPFEAAPLEIVPLPGHTPDHLTVWDPERRILASGDLYLGVKVRVAHHDESPAVLVQSLRTAAALEPVLLLDAHRGPIADPAPLLRAKANWIEAVMGDVRALASAGVGEREITRRLLGREELVGWVSFGEYSRRSLVRALMRDE